MAACCRTRRRTWSAGCAPQSIDPPTAMPDLGVTERDARDIAAYLATLK
jgi:cytochrome c1